MSSAISLRNLAAALLALAVCAIFAGTAAAAAESGAFYRAELAAPASQQTIITDGIAWKCEGSTCSAAKGNSRDAIVCARLVKKVGPLTGFASRKGTLEGDDLARCNRG